MLHVLLLSGTRHLVPLDGGPSIMYNATCAVLFYELLFDVLDIGRLSADFSYMEVQAIVSSSVLGTSDVAWYLTRRCREAVDSPWSTTLFLT